MRPVFVALIFGIFVLGTHSASAQKKLKSPVPERYTLEDNDEYRKYANDVLKCIDWIEKAKPTDDDASYSEVVNFLGEWVSGCPFFNYTTNVRIDAVYNGAPELRVFNKAGWTRSAIESNYKSSNRENYLAGVRCAIKAYKTYPSIARTKTMDELISVEKSGKLKDWIDDRL
jgi:hypothetical protein